MNTLGERIQYVLKDKKISRKELAEKLDVSTMAVGNLIKNEVKKPRILEISMALGISPRWLSTGEGDIYLNTDELVSGNNIIESADNNHNYQDTHVEIEKYDIKLSAGNGNTVEWVPRKSDSPLLFTEAWFKVKKLSPSNCKAMYVRGHSMSPVLENWDTVVIDTSDTDIIDGEIYALIYKNSFYIKQVVRTGVGVTLISFNPSFTPIDINESDLQYLKIIGRKVWRGG